MGPDGMTHSSFMLRFVAPPGKRDIKKVPFVELFGDRLQGVVSSGSDIERVYVSFFAAESLDFYCSTNNNRPCGGLGIYPCKHLQALLQEAIAIAQHRPAFEDQAKLIFMNVIMKRAGKRFRL